MQRAGKTLSRWIGFTACTLLLLSLCACDYGRMREDEAFRTYERQLPEMPKRIVPVEDGVEVLRQSNPEELKNPIPPGEEAVALGAQRYVYYCIQCHGPKADGNGTVGQSFAPLPSNLTSPDVLGQSDGELYYKIYLGIRRHPPLYYTLAEPDGWTIIQYLRALAEQPKG